MSGESINIQLGPYSNFVASHIWNLQYELSQEQSLGYNFDTVTSDKDKSDEDSSGASQATVKDSLSYNPSSMFTRMGRGISQVPRSVVVDYCYNMTPSFTATELNEASGRSLLWAGSTQVVHRSTRMDGSERWIDNILLPYHDQSIQSLPSSVSASTFNSLFSGIKAGSSFNMTTVVEDTCERVRVFAEECDYLSAISIFADLDDGFAGLTTSLLPYLREDYGNSMVMPVWGFSYDNYVDIYHTKNLQEKIRSIQLPMTYAGIEEYASVFCPLSAQAISSISPLYASHCKSKSLTSSIFAVAIDTATSPMRYSKVSSPVPRDHSANHMHHDEDHGSDSTNATESNCFNSRQWLESISSRSRFPIVSLETSYPREIDVSDENLDLWPYLRKDTAGSSGRDGSDVRSNMASSKNVMNTFLLPLSLAATSCKTDSAVEMNRRSPMLHGQRSPVNCVFVRGPTRPDLRSRLFMKCFDSNYSISLMSHIPQAIRIQSRFPVLKEDGSISDVSYLSTIEKETIMRRMSPTISAIGVDACTKYHLNKILEHWTNTVVNHSTLSAVFEKVGYSKDDRKDIEESLHGICAR